MLFNFVFKKEIKMVFFNYIIYCKQLMSFYFNYFENKYFD